MPRTLNTFLFGTRTDGHLLGELAWLAARLFAGLAMAVAHGFGKIPPPDMLVEGVAKLGFPAPVLFSWLAALAEAGGGLLLALGLFTRPAALFVGFTMGVAGFLVHRADPFQVKELAFLFLSLALVFAARGGGRFSVDALIAGRR